MKGCSPLDAFIVLLHIELFVYLCLALALYLRKFAWFLVRAVRVELMVTFAALS